MKTKSSFWRRRFVLNEKNIFFIIITILVLVAVFSFLIQWVAEKGAFTLPGVVKTESGLIKEGKNDYEILKLAAEVRQIRSDTSGSLFWLKLVALFVTVGGAVGGYLVAQSTITKKKIRFELRKNIDESYQQIIQELSAAEPLLRAASAVKLGGILQNFPDEWVAAEESISSDERRAELVQLTKQVLAAALAIEKNEKVLKTITIALARKPAVNKEQKQADLSNLDLSWANAADAYWADVDFSSADFFRANCSQASFRRSVLTYTQFYHCNLTHAVFSKASCANTNFKFADLRHADFTGALLYPTTNFEGAKVYGMKLGKEMAGLITDTNVDVSGSGDGSNIKKIQQWIQEDNTEED